MTNLISSILSSYYVPPVIFNVKDVAMPNGSMRTQSKYSIEEKNIILHCFALADDGVSAIICALAKLLIFRDLR